MLSFKLISTIFYKYTVLICNFILVLYTTSIWGSEGRGIIALIFTNISLVNILTNITSGSSIAFYASKKSKGSLMFINLAGTLFLSCTGIIVICMIFGWADFSRYFLISVLLSLTNSIATYYLGRGEVKKYNILFLFNALFVLIVLTCFVLLINTLTIDYYFYSLYIGLSLSLLVGLYFLYFEKETMSWSYGRIKSDFREVISYGFKNELSYFFQLLCFRFSYFIIATEISLSALGIFSVAVSIVESIWVVSRSISAVHYSEVINNIEQTKSNRAATKNKAKQSLVISILLSLIIICIPNEVFGFVFGKDFTGIRFVLIYLIPGCITIAFSDLYGHYFAAIGSQMILIKKSLIGLIILLPLLYLLVPLYEIKGVCIAMNIAYIIQSMYLIFQFNRVDYFQKQLL
jgi:O-antigen/teichoic acid export membrane protein